MDFNADDSAAVIKESSKLREFLTERINQFYMKIIYCIGKENCHNLWNMTANDELYKYERG